MKEQDAAHSLIQNKFYWIKIQQWKDRDTRIEDKWSVAKWDGESFEELNEMYRIEEVIEIGEQIPSNDELTRLRSELQQKDEEISLREAQQDVMATDTVRLLDQIEYQNKTTKEDHDKIKKLEFELQQERELRKELVECIESYVDLELFANPKPIESLITKAKLK